MFYSAITALLTALLLILCFFAYNKYQERKEKSSNTASEPKAPKAQHTNDSSGTNEYLGLNTRELCMKVLEKLNCQTILHDEAIYFSFQSENFIITTPENGAWIRVYDRVWIESSLDDLDDVCNIRTAVNTANIHQPLNCLYQIDQENKNISVSTWGQFLLVPQIPHIEAYMSSVLSGFFDAHRVFLYEYDKLKKKETSANDQSA